MLILLLSSCTSDNSVKPLAKNNKIKQSNKFIAETIVTANFEELKSDLINEIIGQGLVIAHKSNIAEMLNRTGKDIGIMKQTYSHSYVIEFCSASLSRATTDANPNNVVFCPFSISIFQLKNEPKKVHISYLNISKIVDPEDVASVKSLKAVEDLLALIVEEVIF